MKFSSPPPMLPGNGGVWYQDSCPQAAHPVVLLHGIGSDSHSWGYQIHALKQAGYRPIAPDIPGFGMSGYRCGGWSVPKVAGLLHDWILGMGIQRFSLVGISMGGAIALQFVLDYPELVKQLVLVNTFACLRPRRVRDAGMLLGGYMRAGLAGLRSEEALTREELHANIPPIELQKVALSLFLQRQHRVYRGAMRSLGLFNVRPQLCSIKTRTMVLSGGEDKTIPLERQRELYLGIPGARHVVIPHSGHGVIVEQPIPFNRALVSFLKADEGLLPNLQPAQTFHTGKSRLSSYK